jgi:hypothetical protein
MDVDENDDHYQEFRVLSASSIPISNDTILVASKLDKTGKRIVLWRDIQREIDHAHRIRNGKKSVSFMTDHDFEEYVQDYCS